MGNFKHYALIFVVALIAIWAANNVSAITSLTAKKAA